MILNKKYYKKKKKNSSNILNLLPASDTLLFLLEELLKSNIRNTDVVEIREVFTNCPLQRSSEESNYQAIAKLAMKLYEL